MEKSEIVVLFDIDYTLFDTENYRQNVFSQLAEISSYPDKEAFVKKALELYFEQRKDGYFDQKKFLQALIKIFELSVDLPTLEKAFDDPDIFKSSLFKECESVLEQLSDVATIGIFSGGKIPFQHKKLASIKHRFHADHIFINEEDKKNDIPTIVHMYRGKKLYIIDDLLDVLAEAKKGDLRITTIWIKRGVHVKEQTLSEENQPDYTIYTLEEVLPIIGG